MIYSILLQSAGSGNQGLLMIGLMVLVMYLFFFRPQMKRQREEKKFQQEISKGMRVVTTSGIHGKILNIDDSTVILESENTRLKVDRTAINKQMSDVYNPKPEKESKKKEDSKK